MPASPEPCHDPRLPLGAGLSALICGGLTTIGGLWMLGGTMLAAGVLLLLVAAETLRYPARPVPPRRERRELPPPAMPAVDDAVATLDGWQ